MPSYIQWIIHLIISKHWLTYFSCLSQTLGRQRWRKLRLHGWFIAMHENSWYMERAWWGCVEHAVIWMWLEHWRANLLWEVNPWFGSSAVRGHLLGRIVIEGLPWSMAECSGRQNCGSPSAVPRTGGSAQTWHPWAVASLPFKTRGSWDWAVQASQHLQPCSE